jgi:hypothetical protein
MTDAPATPKAAIPAALQAQLRSMSGDMTFLAIFEIIIGALYCLTIIGAAIGIPMIFAGMRLKESAEAFTSYTTAAESGMLRGALEKLGRHFHIHKILVIVSIALTILYVIFVVFLFGLFLSGVGGGEWE